MMDNYLYVIIALLPLSAGMLVFQNNPYHALIMRGIMGAIAALVYATFGAVDVALTEALVGTMLVIALYAVAVRSSLVMRLGVLAHTSMVKDEGERLDRKIFVKDNHGFERLMHQLRALLKGYHMRLELVSYPDESALHEALVTRKIHTICVRTHQVEQGDRSAIIQKDGQTPYLLKTRIRRLYDIMQTGLSTPAPKISYLEDSDLMASNSRKRSQ